MIIRGVSLLAVLSLACATAGGPPPRSFLTLGIVQAASQQLGCEPDDVTVFDTGDRLWARGCGRELSAGLLEQKVDDRERTELRRMLWPANDLYGPFGIKDEQVTSPRKMDGTRIAQAAEAQPIPEQRFPVRARCVLRTDGMLHQCYVMARTVEVAEAFGKTIPSQRLQPAYVHGHSVASVYSFAATISLKPEP